MTRLHVALSLSIVVCIVVGCIITPRVTALSLNHEIIASPNRNPNDVDQAQDTNPPGLQFRVSEGTGQPESRETKAPPTTTPPGCNSPAVLTVTARPCFASAPLPPRCSISRSAPAAV